MTSNITASICRPLLSGLAELGAHELRAFDHRFQFLERHLARQVLHPAVGRDDDVLDATKGRARRMRAATFSGASTVMSLRSITPRMIVLPGRDSSTEQSRLDCAVSIETWLQLQPASSPRNE